MSWHEAARAMKAADPSLTNADLARTLGVDKSTLWKVLNPEAARRYNERRREAKRAWEDAYDRPLCACGNRMSVGAHRRGYRQCRDCRDAETAARYGRIVGMRRAGFDNREIAVALDMSTPAVASLLCRARMTDPSIPLAPYMQPGRRKRAA